VNRAATGLRALSGGFRLQLGTILAVSDYVMPLAVVPFTTLVLVTVFAHGGRADLTETAFVAPALMGLWAMSLFVAGEIVDSDRSAGILEPTLATPAGIGGAIVGRVLAVNLVGAVSFGESWVVAAVTTGRGPGIVQPGVFTAAVLATVAAMSGAALLMAAAFVMARSARIFQNSLSYPFYLLSGVVVPISFLPGPVRPLCRLVFLSWSAELLRATLAAGRSAGPGPELLGIAVTGGALGVAGAVALRAVSRRVRTTGSASWA
jgi:ABC-2 type transport system permease protein